MIQKWRLAGTCVDSAHSDDSEVQTCEFRLAARESTRRGNVPGFAFAALHESDFAEHGMEVMLVAEVAAYEHLLDV